MAVNMAITDHVAEITLDRPAVLNALNIEDLESLRKCLLQARDNPDVRALLLTGSGTDPDSGPLLALLAVAYWPGAARLPQPDARAVR